MMFFLDRDEVRIQLVGRRTSQPVLRNFCLFSNYKMLDAAYFLRPEIAFLPS